jgi:hypothetical protein
MSDPNKLICPHCKQPLSEVRAGIRMPPLKAKIFDVIKAAGAEGITSSGVISSVYYARKKPAIAAVKSHVWQMNDALEETNFVIISQAGHWQLATKPRGKNRS